MDQMRQFKIIFKRQIDINLSLCDIENKPQNINLKKKYHYERTELVN